MPWSINGVQLPFQPSEQQVATFDWVQNGTGSAVLEAVAGSGKTTTVTWAAKYMQGSVIFVAFNKSIATEMGAKLKAIGSSARAMTLHAVGFAAWRRLHPKVVLNEKKTDGLMEALKVPEPYETFVRKLVSLAKLSGFCIEADLRNALPWEEAVAHHDLEDSLTEAETIGDGIRWAMQVLEMSLKQDTTSIDFDDMIHAPLYHGASFYQNDWVIIDEAQDTNTTRRMLVRKMLKRNGRLLAVGDRHQAIYGFTGADYDALDQIRAEFGAIQLPLTVSYRCPTNVVKLAQTWVSHIEAAHGAPAGEVSTMGYGIFVKLPEAELTAKEAVVCRNTKPLVATAYALIRRGVGCHVEGRDIGKGLLAMCSKWRVSSCRAFRVKLEEWTPNEIAKFNLKKQENRAESLLDKVETLFVIMDQLTENAPMNDLRAAITKLFSDTPDGCTSQNLTLCTVHKAKGREWGTVYLLGRAQYMPSKYAKQDWQKGQETNLMYVAVTRAKSKLVDVTAPPPAEAK